ncbi:MAG: biopolymer transporter ExbD [Paludibacteraceae bacterium]|jgi:biopolymer transport protein ExbD|nr:biopolymer transporter ExbD [Paludibacteraceae bacterium]MBQ5779461.1 biopolymer transporter ExbD [Paludibacteraceae bacterium]
MGLKRRSKIDPSFNMSSMTDMMFLLLLFFMIASTMSAPNDLRIKLPQSKSKASTKIVLVKVNIDSEGNYAVAEGNGKATPIAFEELEGYLTNAMARDTSTFVSLHADENIAYKEIVKVLDIANQNKLKIVIATKPESK